VSCKDRKTKATMSLSQSQVKENTELTQLKGAVKSLEEQVYNVQ